ncbi:hypothetical protein [Natronobacterium gregoryi]|uniref:Uncharacterized protein n=2 Tax=Natronobacterium gregoryi TaxID=44930 RepID=L0AGX5_NATGS|nr:hypothetical protein [Natronobacterium gregoryi]AFZ72664.1 hypothetical protein Natgr_1453 [Natronobacterium gregoryi SP2]ELY69048.1 hypothetical protein C490_08656 [Natronobacterium gregoryi SP2]PLK20616.1 hypothetical protein CYV19_08405 [Natronobacterium gregoryi SP2]SFI90976.1 hypothetical protein SAMN05443661_10945 [Natronobacterium gregoryi]
MNSNSRALPPDALPPGWSESTVSDDELAYRHCQLPLEFVAARTTADNCHPGLGLGCCWELQYGYPVGNQSVSDVIGRVSTRRAAVDGLLECMHGVHETIESVDSPVTVGEVLECVSLSSLVPAGSLGPDER